MGYKGVYITWTCCHDDIAKKLLKVSNNNTALRSDAIVVIEAILIKLSI